MTRATPMPPEERRASLIEATIPLLLQYGPSLTTKQVAEAAGVAEGTIFRVFHSLPDLIDATTREALSAPRLRRDIDSVNPGDTLLSKSRAAVEILTHRMADIRSLLHTVHQRTEPADQSPGFDSSASPRSSGSGRLNQQTDYSPGFDTARRAHGLNQQPGDERLNQHGACLRDELEARRDELERWLLDQLEPHVGELAIEPAQYVEFLRTIALGHVFNYAQPDVALTPETLAALALTGARKATSC